MQYANGNLKIIYYMHNKQAPLTSSVNIYIVFFKFSRYFSCMCARNFKLETTYIQF